jgi:hypothetical protein
MTGRVSILFFVLAFSVIPESAFSQLSGHNSKGDYGLFSGTQSPPGWYMVGNYSFTIFPGVTNNALEFPPTGVDTRTSTGLADLYVQPVNLGWTTPRADFIAGLGLFAPTGEYEAGGDSNRGLGMWSYELFAGTTLYFDEARTWHFAATAFYETHGKKDGTDIRVGDILTLEGGLGKSFMQGAASAGIAYYGQWKISDDDFGAELPTLPNRRLGKNRVYGIGPELMIPLATTSGRPAPAVRCREIRSWPR